MKLNMMNKEKMIICVLAVLLVIAVVYIGVTKYQAAKEERENALIQYGAQLAVVQIMQEAAKCGDPVPVYAGNVTLNLVAAECLQQASASK